MWPKLGYGHGDREGRLRAEIHDQMGGLRAEIAKIPFAVVKWLAALADIAAAIATAVYNIWLR